ncbi:MAG: T9SS type A sorting domain-containing protein [Chlorobi bacterium]|nr:T9SS type A sorting domain-containing protein [Chlorobiota bacterium]
MLYATKYGALLLCVTASLMAQIPFTARQGIGAAKEFVGTTNTPSALGTSIFPPGTAATGRSLMWMYAFMLNDQVVGVQVIQPTNGSFQASSLSTPDTSTLPIYINAVPLPEDLIDSDSAMAIFTANDVYRQWTGRHSAGQVLLMAGRMRDQGPLPLGTPAWVFSATDIGNTSELWCWCKYDGSMSGCQMMEQGGYPFSAHDGLEFAQGAANTTEQPCLIGTAGAAHPDTNGLSPAWVYVFPSGDSVVAVYTQGLAPGIFHATNVPLDDTSSNDMPFYVRATAFQSGWINSTAAMERMRQTEAYRMLIEEFYLDTTTAMLFGGRARPQLAYVGVSEGTAIWLFTAIGVRDANTAQLVCWCNMENTTTPFANCLRILNSAVDRATGTILVLAPNPTTDGAIMQTNDGQPIEQVTVYDVHGRVQLVPLLSYGSTAWLDVQYLSSGTYSVVVKAGGRFYRQPLNVVR